MEACIDQEGVTPLEPASESQSFTMENSGQELERLVQEIEQHLLPEGFEVALNKCEFNAAGNQLAEFDIVITGRLGSSSINWLIECRDRPSEGPAPGAWIEQLVGRKRRFKFDKVIAVSTTGFAKGSVEFAESEGVVLRTVKELADIGSDFNIKEARYYAHQVTVGRIDIKARYPELDNAGGLTGAQYKFVQEATFQTFDNFVASHIDLSLSELSGDASFRLEFYCEDIVEVRVNDRVIRIRGFAIPVQVDIFIYEAKALTMNLYSEMDAMIGRDSTFGFELPTGSFTFRVLFLNNFDGTQDVKFFPPKTFLSVLRSTL